MGILAGTVFVTNNGFPSASAIAYGNGAQIDGNFDVNNNVRPAPGFAYLAYGNNGGIGQFKSGTTANIGYRKGGKFGFITLSTLVTGVPLRTQITVSQRGIDIANSTSILAGDCNTLPVELSAFKAEAKENAIALLWETASELNNAGFEVERSENGKTFKAISFVEGKGTTYEAQKYWFEDKTVRQNITYYYRLKQIDFDGQFEYTDIVTATLERKVAVGTFYPNPASDGMTQLDYSSSESGEVNATVYNVNGQVVATFVRSVARGSNILDFNFSALSAGSYFVKLENGSDRQYQKLIRQ
ncbi:MAG: T9SS type A sorting domain-containing protein [Saprospiraceae bacterium]|nr:T9SS type A sorting domain-containing protein [Saprospiraceae bacterium]